MLKKLTILFLTSSILLIPNVPLAQDEPVEEVSNAINMVEKDFVSGKEIDYVHGYVEGVDSCCKWWNWCWYQHKVIPNVWVHLHIRASNEQGGEKWVEAGKSQTDQNGYYSFGKLKNYCGPIQVNVPTLKHFPVIDHGRECGLLDSGRELDIVGKI